MVFGFEVPKRACHQNVRNFKSTTLVCRNNDDGRNDDNRENRNDRSPDKDPRAHEYREDAGANKEPMVEEATVAEEPMIGEEPAMVEEAVVAEESVIVEPMIGEASARSLHEK